MLATPIRPIEIARGELAWAMVRGVLYSAAFLVIMVVLDLTTPLRALAMFPASVLVGFAFGALGMTISTLIRSWQDFDLMGSGQFALFLLSGTFLPPPAYREGSPLPARGQSPLFLSPAPSVPPTAYPAALRWLVEVTPLYRSVDLMR